MKKVSECKGSWSDKRRQGVYCTTSYHLAAEMGKMSTAVTPEAMLASEGRFCS